MAELSHVNIGAAARPPAVPFSHAVTDGDYAFLSGLLASDAVEPGVELGDIAAETRVVMELLKGVLARLGLDFGDVVRVTVYMTDLDQVEAMNAVYLDYVDAERPPARTCVGVARLQGGSHVEIDCIARLRRPAGAE